MPKGVYKRIEKHKIKRQCTKCNKIITRASKSNLCASCVKLKINPSYSALHTWVRRTIPLKEKCEFCGRNEYLEYANKTGEYKREIDDWIQLCKICHNKYDDIYNKALKSRYEKTGKAICVRCKREFKKYNINQKRCGCYRKTNKLWILQKEIK